MKVDEITQTIAFQCRNCGQCCGPIVFSKADKNRIAEYLASLESAEFERIKKNVKKHQRSLTCGFRDERERKCFIHPVRPEICRMQGFYEGLPCPHQPHFATRSREEGRLRLARAGVTEA